jgi:hypothetical protein
VAEVELGPLIDLGEERPHQIAIHCSDMDPDLELLTLAYANHQWDSVYSAICRVVALLEDGSSVARADGHGAVSWCALAFLVVIVHRWADLVGLRLQNVLERNQHLV